MYALAHDINIINSFNRLVRDLENSSLDAVQDVDNNKNVLLNYELKIKFPVINYQTLLLMSDIENLNTDSILLLNSKVGQNDSFTVCLGEQSISCKLTKKGLLQVDKIC